jgi:hypothetical protein
MGAAPLCASVRPLSRIGATRRTDATRRIGAARHCLEVDSILASCPGLPAVFVPFNEDEAGANQPVNNALRLRP